MDLVIDVPDELDRVLKEKAAKAGKPVEEYMRDLLCQYCGILSDKEQNLSTEPDSRNG